MGADAPRRSLSFSLSLKLYNQKEVASMRKCTGQSEPDSKLLYQLCDGGFVPTPLWTSFSRLHPGDCGHVWAIKRGRALSTAGHRESPWGVRGELRNPRAPAPWGRRGSCVLLEPWRVNLPCWPPSECQLWPDGSHLFPWLRYLPLSRSNQPSGT